MFEIYALVVSFFKEKKQTANDGLTTEKKNSFAMIVKSIDS